MGDFGAGHFLVCSGFLSLRVFQKSNGSKVVD